MFQKNAILAVSEYLNTQTIFFAFLKGGKVKRPNWLLDVVLKLFKIAKANNHFFRGPTRLVILVVHNVHVLGLEFELLDLL